MKNILKNERGIAHYIMPLFIMLATAIGGAYWIVSSHANAGDSFIDISDPQCDKALLNQIPRQERGVIGLNGTYGDFGRNKCLSKEVRKFDSYSLYVVANYPSKHCSARLSARACGVKAGQYNVKAARSLHFGKWWIDVEAGAGWSGNTSANTDFLQGMIDAMDNSTHPVGFYSLPSHWNGIVGDGGFQREMWYATGQSSAAEARAYCNNSIGHNHTVMVQYVLQQYGQQLDRSVYC